MRYFLELCLTSVTAALKDINAEIIVVDNNSTDDSCAMVKQLFPEVKLIENNQNLGFSKGNNIGVAKAKGELLCILNPDTVVAEDTFKNVLDFAEIKPNLGIVGCQLIDGTGKFLPESKRQVPTPKVALQKMMGKTTHYYTNHVQPNAVGKTEVLVGAFMVLKRKVYNEVKGFDEDYFMYGEDIDLSYKVLKAGYTNYYFGSATVIHFKGESTLKNKIYAKRFYNAMGIFYKKHFSANKLFSAVVINVLKLVALGGRKLKASKIQVDNTCVISQDIDERFKAKLIQPVSLKTNLSKLENNTLVIFDSEHVSFGSIIDHMKQHAETTENAYRILLKSSNFSLGSDSSTGRGEVIRF